jgi:membrane protease YdiL (CAAX protease family)
VEERENRYGPEGEEPGEGPGPSLFGRMNNWFLLIYAFACYLMSASLSGILYLGGNVVLSVILPGIFGYLIPLMVLTRRYRLSFSREFRLLAPDLVTTAIVLAAAAAAIYPVDAISWLSERSRPVDTDYINILLAFKPKGIWHFALMALGLGLISPLGEELLFRGLIQSVFHRNMGVTAAIFISALVFGISHGTLYVVPGVTAMGLLLAFVFYRTGNLLYPLMMHCVFNLFSLYRLSRISEETLRSFEWKPPDAVSVAVSLVIFLIVLSVFERHTRRSA